MHPHQHATLVEELRRPEYAGLSADDAFAAVNAPGVTRRLTRTRYEGVEGFGGGVPGFPNKVRREEFDAAWQEVTGG